MKKFYKTQLTVIFLTASILLNGCLKEIYEVEPCVPKICSPVPSGIERTINGYDFDSASEYYNQVVVNYKFSQTTIHYIAPNACSTCPTDSHRVDLLISNQTNKMVHFDFSISFVLNLVSWNYHGVATINPNETFEADQISNNEANITVGQFTIQTANITYQ